MNISLKKADSIGVVSSVLCVLHCMATPLLFAIQTQIVSQKVDKPLWWSTFDLVFIGVSALAIYNSTRFSSKKWVKSLLWFNWILLLIFIINEKLEYFNLSENLIYIPSLALIGIHIYNGKYCQCNCDRCETNN